MEPILHPLGKISKTHGYHGTLVLISELPFDVDTKHLEEIFTVIDGLQVPFPVEAIEWCTDTSAYIKLEFVDNQKEANELVGRQIFTTSIICKSKPEEGWNSWIGFTVNDLKYGKIGIVQQIKDYKGNIVMQVKNDDKEILISLYPELITRIDQNAKNIQITAPEGYF